MDFNVSEIKTKVWENRKMILILIILFLFAMSIRSNIVRYEGNYLFEPDAYYHARLVQEIVQQGYVSEIDPNVYYQIEGGMPSQAPSLYHYISAGIYSITNFGNYNKESLAFSIQFLPLIFGALISIAMYFLGKEVFNSKKLGIIAGFLTAITPAFAYRTMAGAQGDNSLGFLWMVIGFIFFVRALKSDKLDKTDLINTLLAGVFFAAMAFTWMMNLLIPVIVIPAAAIMLLFIVGNTKKPKAIIKSEPFYFIIKVFIPLVIYTIASYAYGENWISTGISYAQKILPFSSEVIFILISTTLIGFIALALLIYRGQGKLKSLHYKLLILVAGLVGGIAGIIIPLYIIITDLENKKILSYLAVLGLFIGLFATIALFATVPDLFYAGEGRTTLGSMVGEESVGLASFGIKYNILVVLPLAGLFVLPLGMIFFKRKDVQLQIILWLGTIVTLLMAWYKLKFTFVFGLGLVMGALLLFDFIFEAFKKYDMNKGIEEKITVAAILFIMIIGIGASQTYLIQFQPFANQDTKWIDAMDWIKDNTDSQANFLNWWGDGHQLAFVTERNFSSDNRNASYEANKAYGEFSITTDVNRGYNIITKEIGANYVILQANNFSSGPTYEYYVANKIDSTLSQKYYGWNTQIIGCSDVNEGKICNGQIVPLETYNTQFSEIWKSTPSEFYNGQIPTYYYGDGDLLYIINQTYNNTNLAKVYFNSEETSKLYEQVYSNQGMKIFKVK